MEHVYLIAWKYTSGSEPDKYTVRTDVLTLRFPIRVAEDLLEVVEELLKKYRRELQASHSPLPEVLSFSYFGASQ